MSPCGNTVLEPLKPCKPRVVRVPLRDLLASLFVAPITCCREVAITHWTLGGFSTRFDAGADDCNYGITTSVRHRVCLVLVKKKYIKEHTGEVKAFNRLSTTSRPYHENLIRCPRRRDLEKSQIKRETRNPYGSWITRGK